MSDLDPAQPDNQEGEDRPQWLPDNFKTGEDLASSYRESQRKITEEATARRNLEQLVAQQQQSIEQLQAAQQPVEETDWDAYYTQDPVATQKALAEQAARDAVAEYAKQSQQQYAPVQASQVEVIAELAFNKLQAERGELTPEFRTVMSEIVSERPYLIPDHAYQSPGQLAAALDVVYELAEKKAGPQTQQSQADLMRTMKLNAQTADGVTGRQPSADDATTRWSEIANAPSNKLGL